MRRALRPSLLSIVLSAVCWPGSVMRADTTVADGPRSPFEGAGRHGRAEVLVLGAKTLFGSNASTLTPAGEAALDRLVERLADHGVAEGSAVGIRIVGHADGVGPAAYNQLLSEQRAAVVGDIVGRAFPDVPLLVEGRGESTPVASDATAAGRALNRRVEIHVVSAERAARPLFPSALPASLDAESAERLP